MTFIYIIYSLSIGNTQIFNLILKKRRKKADNVRKWDWRLIKAFEMVFMKVSLLIIESNQCHKNSHN